MNGKLILIASYPKSGNTWVRLFFDSLLRGPVSINDIGGGNYGYRRRLLFDSYAPSFASDLTQIEIENWLPDLYETLAVEAEGLVFVKVHDYCRRTAAGRWLFPPEHVAAVVHLVRHPFDVAVSYAYHRGVTVAEAVSDLCDERHIIAGQADRLALPLSERPGSWSTNVESWMGEAPYSIVTVRYEDLCADPHAQFERLVRALGIQAPEEDVLRAIDAASFERSRAEELRSGFRERPQSSRAFFRHGRPGAWVDELDDKLRNRLVLAHRPAMERFGYGGGPGTSPQYLATS